MGIEEITIEKNRVLLAFLFWGIGYLIFVLILIKQIKKWEDELKK